MKHDGPVPLLREDGSSMDWARATYSAKITISESGADVVHTLAEAPQLDALIAAGDAQYVLEARCPQTLYARVAYSRDANVRCEWDPRDVYGEMFLIPGLVSVRACQLDTEGLNQLWGSEPIDVGKGRWLARGSIVRTQSLAASLLEFLKKPELTDGEMRVEPDTGSGDLRFKVYLAPNYFDMVIRTNRDVQIAALIAAMARMPWLDSGDGESYATLAQVKAKLQESNVPVWDSDPGDFDPARAATAIERFYIQDGGEDS